MKHVSQIYRSTTYKILDSKSEMVGVTVIGVFDIGRVDESVTAFVNTASILVLDNLGRVVTKDNLLDSDIEGLEMFTGITKNQLL